MVAVAKYTDTGKVFESQSYQDETAKANIVNNLNKDAQTANVDVDIVCLTDTEFEELRAH